MSVEADIFEGNVISNNLLYCTLYSLSFTISCRKLDLSFETFSIKLQSIHESEQHFTGNRIHRQKKILVLLNNGVKNSVSFDKL